MSEFGEGYGGMWALVRDGIHTRVVSCKDRKDAEEWAAYYDATAHEVALAGLEGPLSRNEMKVLASLLARQRKDYATIVRTAGDVLRSALKHCKVDRERVVSALAQRSPLHDDRPVVGVVLAGFGGEEELRAVLEGALPGWVVDVQVSADFCWATPAVEVLP